MRIGRRLGTSKMLPLTTTIEPELQQWLVATAQARKLTTSDFVRRLLNSCMLAAKKEPTS